MKEILREIFMLFEIKRAREYNRLRTQWLLLKLQKRVGLT